MRNGLVLGSIPSRVIPKTVKKEDTDSLLTTQHARDDVSEEMNAKSLGVKLKQETQISYENSEPSQPQGLMPEAGVKQVILSFFDDDFLGNFQVNE